MFINVILGSFYFIMQTMTVTQSKNTHYFSVGYSVTFIPFDAFSSLSGKEQREFRIVACSPVVLHLQSLKKRWNLNYSLVHTYTQPLTFISNFSSLWKFLSESSAPYYAVHSAPLTMVWCEWGLVEYSTKGFFICKILI